MPNTEIKYPVLVPIQSDPEECRKNRTASLINGVWKSDSDFMMTFFFEFRVIKPLPTTAIQILCFPKLTIDGIMTDEISSPEGPRVNRITEPVFKLILFNPAFRVPTHKLPSSSSQTVEISLPLNVLLSLGSFLYTVNECPS